MLYRKAEANGGTLDPDDNRNVTDLLVDQIEFADVILLNKVDLCPKDEVKRVETLVRRLNPGAKIIPTTRCRVDLKVPLIIESYTRLRELSWT
jgi:G3E family GTPase